MRGYRNAFLLFVLLAASLTACAPGHPVASMPQTAPPRSAALRNAVEQYYAATSVADMRSAVETARREGPDTALYHEIAASLAGLEDRYPGQFDHLAAALLDPADESALIHMSQLFGLPWSIDQRQRGFALSRSLAAGHPRRDVRRAAAYYAMVLARTQGDTDTLEALRPALGFQPPLSIIGPFDNDQGKGFDIAYPPEQEIDMEKSYQGMVVPVSWRQNPPVRQYGDLDLAHLVYPFKWAVAYAVSAFRVSREGAYELRLSSTGPVKVWVNDIEVFADRHVGGEWLFEGIVFPVNLRRGVNRILVKSATKKGVWKLGLSVSETGGQPPAEGSMEALAPQTPYAVSGPAPGASITAVEALMGQWPDINPKTPRGMSLLYLKMRQLGLEVPVVKFAEMYAAGLPGAIIPQFSLARALWNNGERGRTSDILSELVKEVGNELPLISIKQARFLKQSKLTRKARNMLKTLCSSFPDRPTACLRLSEMYEKEKWKEDRLRVLQELNGRVPGRLDVLWRLADAYDDLDFTGDTLAIRRQILSAIPRQEGSLVEMYKQALWKNDLDGAEGYARLLVQSRPYYISSWRRLGEVLRRRRNISGAETAYRRIVELAPTSPVGFRRLGDLYYQAGNSEEGIARWKLALERNPDDEKLANRLNYLAPPTWGPWAVDVPDRAALSGTVKLRKSTTFSDKADTAYLLDHEVCELKPDGSSTEVVTQVVHALNKKGRDNMTKYKIPAMGRIRILHAYAVSPKGKTNEASSIRGRTIRFRNLDVGSTTVVQYQRETPPSKYLSGYFSQMWSFQGNASQYVNSTYILWAPAAVKVSESWRGEVQRDISRHDALTRYSWQATNVPPLILEPMSPPPQELVWRLAVSTVPDWDMFRKWEKALLEDVFRSTAELETVTGQVVASAPAPMDKLYAIQDYLEREIRYQTDYEHSIAGVKPHAAPIVLARRYGDCKDKSVLFITMAKIAGVQARFALVRTSNAGPVDRDIPRQQFNHAIVYVPPQQGIETGVFFDPTADGLDVKVLRPDDPGAWAFVLSDDHDTYEWIRIPYQSPGMNFSHETISLALQEDGSARADIALEFQGILATMLRKVARNKELFSQMTARLASALLPGSRVLETQPGGVENLMTPFAMRFTTQVPSMARREGRQLRLAIPNDGKFENLLALSRRTSDLYMGIPVSWQWNTTLIPPKGATIERLPENGSVETADFRFTRRYERSGNTVNVITEAAFLSPRVLVKDYPELRKRMDEVLRMMKDEVVFKLAK